VPIAPSRYYDQVNREPSRRQSRDEALKAQIARVHADNYGVSGARKVWLALTPTKMTSNVEEAVMSPTLERGAVTGDPTPAE
jgi:hypothetical protein